MMTPTVPTVLFPRQVDTDDDDDDDAPLIVPGQPAATTPPAPPPPVNTLSPVPGVPPAVTPAPGAPSPSVNPNAPATNTNGIRASGSVTPLASGLPTSLSNPTSSANPSPNDNKGLSTGASAGIGVGVALAVILMMVGAWMFVRTRRRNRQRKHKTLPGSKSDVETAPTVPGAGPAAGVYRGPGVPELPIGTGAEKYKYELASPIVAQEVHGDREYAAELPGSAVPSSAAGKESEAWSPNPPAYNQNVAGPPAEKKSGVRLFDDAPIDEDEDTFYADDQSRGMYTKGGI